MPLRATCILFLVLAATVKIQAQASDAFDLFPGNWKGDTSKFALESGMLRSNSEQINDTFYLSGNIVPDTEMEWNLTVNLRFNTSSVNFTDIYLMSDNPDLKKSRNGVYVRIGGTRDEIVLYSLINGVSDTLINGRDNVSAGSNNWIRIKVIKRPDGVYTLFSDINNSGSYDLEGISSLSYPHTYLHCGLLIRQSTSSFFKRHYFDDWYAGKMRKDTIAPQLIASKFIDNRTLRLDFNEALDNSTSDSCCIGLNIGIVNTVFSNQSVQIGFDRNLQWPDTIQLKIQRLKDSSGNIIRDTTLMFQYILPVIPHCRMLRFSELMSDPSPSAGLPDVEYIEIVNLHNEPVQLKNFQIGDPGRTSIIPDFILFPGQYLALYDSAFSGVFTGFGTALGVQSFPSLNNSGDTIWLKNSNGDVCEKLVYSTELHSDLSKTEGGYSLELKDSSWYCDLNKNWGTSVNILGGTPGRKNSVWQSISDTVAPGIAGFNVPLENTIHLDLDEKLDTAKYWTQIKIQVTGFNLKQYGYFENPNPIIRIETEGTVSFGTQALIIISGLSDCSGNVSLEDSVTFYWPEEPKPGDVIINEVLFNPVTGGADFVEILNTSGKTLSLKYLKLANKDTSNAFKNAISLPFNILNPGSFLVLTTDSLQVVNAFVSNNPAVIHEVKSMPSMTDDTGNVWLIHSDHTVIDSVRYSEKYHHELIEDTEGKSLERIFSDKSGILASNWTTASSTSGYGTPGLPNSQSEQYIMDNTPVKMITNIVSPDGDGYQDQLLWEVDAAHSGLLINTMIYNHQGKLVREICRNWIAGNENMFSWDGTDKDGTLVLPGVYILYVEIWGNEGVSLKIRQPVTVTFK